MARYALYRIALTLPLLLGAALLIFVAGRMAPGDPIAIRLGDQYDPEAAQALRRELGLDRPIWLQFTRYVAAAARFDFGESFISPGRRISSIVRETLPISLKLTSLALAAATAVGLTIGIVGAVSRRPWLDRALRVLLLVALSMPNFVVAALLVLVLSLWLGVLPVAGLSGWQSYVLPVTVLAVPPAAYITRISRASMLEVLSEDYIRTAHSKGLGMPRIIVGHALRNAALPIITQIGLSFGYALTGSFIVEVIFNIPGMGRLIYESVVNNDVPVIQGGMLLILTLAVVINTVTDLLYGVLNPAIRVSHVSA